MQLRQRFGNYELVKGDDGTPIELGRGAMGITYKAFDIGLRRPAALKVINARYLEDRSTRLRFLAEARAAASLRHPNVASVFHLGRSRGTYFYAMEFVEGETLERTIDMRGSLDAASTLDIVEQVAAALAAAQQQHIVHRDIKPSNVMLAFGKDGRMTVKVIDFGLAKALHGLESTRSKPIAFAGTPEFASPEKFAGLALDTRSDVYSLGVTLWEMLTGRTPFRGTPGELMYQHQHSWEGRETREARRAPSNLIGSGWLRVASESAWAARRTAA